MSIVSFAKSQEFKRAHACIRPWAYWELCGCLGKTYEGPKRSPLADLELLQKQEAKVKVKL